MTRRFDESLLAPASSVASTTPAQPGFVACSVPHASTPMQQIWQAIYQAAFNQAIMQAVMENQPTRYQRLMYQVSQN